MARTLLPSLLIVIYLPYKKVEPHHYIFNRCSTLEITIMVSAMGNYASISWYHIRVALSYLYIVAIIYAFPILVYWFLTDSDQVKIPYWISVAAIFFTNLIILTEALMSFYIQFSLTPNYLLDLPKDKEYPQQVAILIAAYLPNEINTLAGPIRGHMALELPDNVHLRVIVVYNGGGQTQIDQLNQLITEVNSQPHPNKTLESLNVLNSTSKAANINYAMDYLSRLEMRPEVVALFDADHIPHHTNLKRALKTMLITDADIVQGRNCVGRGSWFIAIEFDVMYCIYHPGGAMLRGFAVFGGSNGYWKFDTLNHIRMDPTMLTEDIDSAMRAIQARYKIVYDRHVVSLEEAPPTFIDLLKQRLRWTQGWSEAALRHGAILAFGTPFGCCCCSYKPYAPRFRIEKVEEIEDIEAGRKTPSLSQTMDLPMVQKILPESFRSSCPRLDALDSTMIPNSAKTSDPTAIDTKIDRHHSNQMRFTKNSALPGAPLSLTLDPNRVASHTLPILNVGEMGTIASAAGVLNWAKGNDEYFSSPRETVDSTDSNAATDETGSRVQVIGERDRLPKVKPGSTNDNLSVIQSQELLAIMRRNVLLVEEEDEKLPVLGFWHRTGLSIQNRIGIFLLLIWREIYHYLASHAMPAGSIALIKCGDLDCVKEVLIILTCILFAFPVVNAFMAYALAGPIHHPKLRFYHYIIYALVSPLYELVKYHLSILGHSRIIARLTKWRVTRRHSPK